MGLRSKDGVDLADLWKEGISTYLGITISGFPNMVSHLECSLSVTANASDSGTNVAHLLTFCKFMAYTPQSPVPLSNGPTIIEAQVETIADMIAKLESEKAQSIEPQRSAEEEWGNAIETMAQYTLLPSTDSWWNGKYLACILEPR